MATNTPFADQAMHARLSDHAPAGGNFTRMQDVADTDLLLHKATPVPTQYGPGYILTLSDLSGGDTFDLLTSGVVVVRQLDQMIESDCTLPCLVNFTKSGRAWIIV